MKLCPSCNNIKENDYFYKNTRTPDGLAYTCKKCMAAYSKKYRAENSNDLANLKKDWYIKNKKHVLNYAADYYKSNKQEIITKVVAYRKKRMKIDPIFKMQKNLRHRLGKLIKQESSSIAISFLGCSLQEFKIHLESQFTSGMTWDNYGKWHIDHIKPLSSFDLSDIEQIKDACKYTNLQPLWAADNILKSNKVQ